MKKAITFGAERVQRFAAAKLGRSDGRRFRLLGRMPTFGAGILVGAVLFGGSLAIAAGVTANPTTSRVFVDGAEVKLEAYNIGGNNFFKLRDIGNEVDFSHIYDLVWNRYSKDKGRKSVDPVVLFKTVLIQHLYGMIGSSAQNTEV